MTTKSLSALPPAPRRIGRVNWRGVWTLYLKESRRFLDSYGDTIVAPTVTTLLFLAIFALAVAGQRAPVLGVDYLVFLVPGLVMMSVMQSAFGNSTETMILAKYMGCTVDFLMPPLSSGELTAAFALAGATRGVIVALAALLACWPFVALPYAQPLAALLFAVGGALVLALSGLIVGIWGERWDHTEAVSNFVVLPLAFLSGAFYSLDQLAGPWRIVAQANPFFYLIDGFRYGVIGAAEGSAGGAALVTGGSALALLVLARRLFASGYKLKS